MSISVLISGDFCPGEKVQKLVEDGKHESIFKGIEGSLLDNDLSITNLECPLSDSKTPIEKSGPNLVAPENIIGLIKQGRFGLVTLANNHILDQGLDGLNTTIELCRENGIDIVGAGLSLNEAKKIFYKEVKGIKIAILNFAEKEFSIASETSPGANPLDIVDNYYSIRDAKLNSDYVLVIVHGGVEHYNLPTPNMVRDFRYFVDIGADAIICSHSHCPTGYEIYKNKPIFYGIGNFVFDRNINNPNWHKGYLVKLLIEKETLETEFEILPYFLCQKNHVMMQLAGNKREIFMAEIYRLSKIIKSDHELNDHWETFIRNNSINIAASFFPFFPFKRRILSQKNLPSIIRKKLLGTWNTLQCQSLLDMYRDGLKEYLKISN